MVVALVSGCTTTHALQGGGSVETMSDFWYYVRWAASLFMWFVALAVLFHGFTDAADGGEAMFGILLTGALAAGGYFFHPGFDSPDDIVAAKQAELGHKQSATNKKLDREKEKAAEAERQRILQKKTEEKRAAFAMSPQGRAKLIRDKITHLTSKRDEKLKPLLQRYDREMRTYKKELTRGLRKGRYRNHEDLIRAGDKAIVLQNKLKRAAILKVTLDWLTQKIARTTVAIQKLDQQAWVLERRVELNEVTPKNEWKDIEKMLATAQAIIEEDTPTSDAQDYAEAEAALFKELAR